MAVWTRSWSAIPSIRLSSATNRNALTGAYRHTAWQGATPLAHHDDDAQAIRRYERQPSEEPEPFAFLRGSNESRD